MVIKIIKVVFFLPNLSAAKKFIHNSMNNGINTHPERVVLIMDKYNPIMIETKIYNFK